MADGKLDFVDKYSAAESVGRIYAKVQDFVIASSERGNASDFVLAVAAKREALEALRNGLHYHMHWFVKCKFPLKIQQSRHGARVHHTLVIAQA